MKRVTLQQVAVEAGVSMSTVSNVLHDHPHVRETLRTRVTAAIDRLGYRPQAIGRQLRSGLTGQVLLAIPNFAQPYFAELARDAVVVASGFGLSVVVQQTDNELQRERSIVDGWSLGAVDGVIFSPSTVSDEELAARPSGPPMVLLGEHSHLDTVDRVSIDSMRVGQLATEHLLERGRERIGMIGFKPTGDRHVVAERHDGYLEALHGWGKEPAGPYVHVAEWTRDNGQSATEELLECQPDVDAVFAANDLLALGALQVLRRSGRRIPEDVMVIGVDDIEEAQYAEPPLSTVRIGRREMMTDAFELLAARMGDPMRPAQIREAPLALVERESTSRV